MDEEQYYKQETPLYFTITAENGRKYKSKVLFYFIMNNRNVVAVQLMEGPMRNDIYPFYFREDEEGALILTNIDDDDEYELACNMLDDLYKAAEDPLLKVEQLI